VGPGWAPRPKVSFVVTSRNDGFGGDMLRRFRLFANNLLSLAEKHHLTGELIVVEWNPPSGPRLHDVLQLYALSDEFPIRYIEVPPAVHHTLRNADVLPLFQMIAKNVGIRRATGQFICATNQDILFSEELIAFLASEALDPGTMYRIDRTDVRAEVPEQLPVSEQLAWCLRNVLRVNGKYGTFEVPWWDVWRDPDMSVRMLRALGRKWKKLVARRGASHLDRRALEFRRFLGRIFRGIGSAIKHPSRVHTNACGDFTLLSAGQWHRLRGYAELPLYSLHVDSLFCYAAVAEGLRQEILRPPARIFHMEHASSWAVMTPEEKLKWFSSKPWIDYSLLCDVQDHMLRQARAVEFNAATWGFGNLEFSETVVGRQETYAVVAESSYSGRGW
jgi:hypothetical protein